jgi:hypothetical protein
MPVKAPPAVYVPTVSAWEFEIGGRYFGSTGRSQYDCMTLWALRWYRA